MVQPGASNKPIVVLVRPQLAENIGMTARAMANFGLSELRLVAPRDGWPNPVAWPPAVRAKGILDAAQVFETLEDAIADCRVVLATAGRARDMSMRITTPEEAGELTHAAAPDCRVAFLFGPEQSGLTNDDIALATAVLAIPTVPDFTSLNLAQAVLLVCYAWFRTEHRDLKTHFQTGASAPATHAEVTVLLAHLKAELDARNHFREAAKEPIMWRNLQAIFRRSPLTSQDVRTLRGVLATLSTRHPKG